MQRMDAYLEIGLRWKAEKDGRGLFDVNLDFDDPEDIDDRKGYGEVPVEIDPEALRQLVGDEPGYGRALAESLFSSETVKEYFRRARERGSNGGVPVHLRLHVDPAAPSRFHAVRWESLRDPDDGSRVTVRKNLLFSRFLNRDSWAVVSPPPKHDLRALVVIADPSDIGDYGQAAPLERIDVEGERRRAEAALTGVKVRELPRDGKPTLSNVLAEIEKGVDILYLVCHGELDDDDRSWVYLENEDGTTADVRGNELIEALNGLTRRPTLAVLCSCASAGRGDAALLGDGRPLAALGPRLAEIGVPAVVAMQGEVTMATAATFMTRFFGELAVDGAVDRAMAEARFEVSGNGDWWMPVLFSRLKRGRTYYLPEFGHRADTWRLLKDRIRFGSITPVIGPGFANGLIGSRKDIALQWAARWQMPLVNQGRDDLATVAQYLRVRMAPDQPAQELRSYLISLLRERYAAELERGELDKTKFDDGRADELLREVGRLRRADSEAPDPYQVAASLRAPVYVTTNWTNLLEDAIRETGREPESLYFDWASETDEPSDVDGTRDEPLVYHLFGGLSDPDSLVLSQDDYFSWLQAWISKRDTPVLPGAVREALTDKTLLFLGYELDDWDFRILFEGIKTFKGRRRRPHVGVQLSAELQSIEPESAQEYLETYFDDDNVTIYWGRLEKFLAQLDEKLKAAG